ncbi:hypothetical protein DXG01_013146 [Tephrocybe rancida]|nr:hypothetical protein DXG01_013146 [Tephrocybe rancida]
MLNRSQLETVIRLKLDFQSRVAPFVDWPDVTCIPLLRTLPSPAQNPSPSEPDLAIRVTHRVINTLERFRYIVVRGELTNLLPSIAIKVVVKFAVDQDYYDDGRIQDLHTQYSLLYTDTLKSWTGKHIPQCYGLFEGGLTLYYLDGEERKKHFACLVFQDCGDPAYETFDRIPDATFRTRLVQIMCELHLEKHVQHGDLRPENVMNVNGVPVLVGFQTTTEDINHDDEVGYNVPIVDGTVEPQAVPCDELTRFLREMKDFWAPVNLRWYDNRVNMREICSVADLYKPTTERYTRNVSDEELWNNAVEHWALVRKVWPRFNQGKIPDIGNTDFRVFLAENPGWRRRTSKE